MSRMNLRLAVLVVLVIGLAGSGLWSGYVPEQQLEAAQDKPLKGEKNLDKYYFGEEMCSQCHDYTVEEAKKKVTTEKSLLYRGIEMHTWKTHDKHKNATIVLSDERAKLMAKNLGYDVTKSKNCLNCHGVFIRPEDDNKKMVDKSSFEPSKRILSGVTCVSCHGAHAEWVNEHAKLAQNVWYDFTLKQKVALGMNDLWNPENRTALCSSCHVGNANEEKFVTHEMYAAGHPPLPGVEIAMFGNALPRHWETLTEKVNRLKGDKDYSDFKKFYKDKLGFDAESGEMEEARLLAISAVGVFKTTVELLEQQAAKHTGKPDSWPEFSNYDCYACHHDLKSDSWRIKRPSSGVAGRPGIRPWSATLVPFIIGDDKGAAEFENDVKTLQKTITAVPFGNPEDVRKASGKLVARSNDILAMLHKRSFDDAASRKLLAQFVQGATKGDYVDFDSARQLGWGLKTLVAELDPAALKQLETKDSPISKLDMQMKMTLPVGQVRIVGPFLEDVLKKMAEYNPDTFRANVTAVAATVKK